MIVTDGRRTKHRRNRVAGAHLRGTGHKTPESKRPRGCESVARRNARAKPVVSVVAAFRGLLPTLKPGCAFKVKCNVPVLEAKRLSASICKSLCIPSATLEALGLNLLVEAGRTDSSCIERVPLKAAGAEPFIFLAGRPAAERAADARTRRT
jgi:hypothetical protein